MKQAAVNNTRVIIQSGDVAKLVVDAIVSPDSADFFMSKGPARAIYKISGVHVRKELTIDRPVKVGDVVVTSAGNLPAKNIIHAAIMEPDAQELNHQSVSKAINNSFIEAEKQKFESIGLPVFSISTSLFPYEVCAKLMISDIFSYFTTKESSIKLVTIAVYEEEAYNIFANVFTSIREIYKI
ncbi:MAG: macro domain-containing protein [bacterium]